MHRFGWPIPTLILVAVTAACLGDGPAGPTAADTTLVVLPRQVALNTGDRTTLSASFVVGGTDTVPILTSVAWSSRDTMVVVVSPAGTATAVAPGATRIDATVGGRLDSTVVEVAASPTPTPTLQLIAQSPAGALVYATAPVSDSSRLFVVAQQGIVYVLRNDTLLSTPFLDIRNRVVSGGERGLLSIAFHPGYASNGYVFVSYTTTGGHSRIERYTATGPETADAASGTLVLALNQPFSNHNGGQIAFGPDGMLYVGFGDGGSGGDPLGAGQNLKTLLGKILRLDVDAAAPYGIPADNPFVGDTTALPEIWAWGLRNPWRFSFDRLTGDLYIGDVGQNAREEVDVQSASSPGGENYGWNVMEGNACYNAATCDRTGKVLPVVDYPHADGCSVTGGYAYRGTTVTQLSGQYLYADYCSGWIRSFTWVTGVPVVVADWPALAPAEATVTSFGQDARGELYVMTGAGRLYRIAEGN